MACLSLAGEFGISCAKNWFYSYQGGNMWAAFPPYVEACRDVLGLDLPVFEKWKAWEDCALHGGFRAMHSEFCIVSDFPEFIHVDEENRPHCETGPSHRWRDGWSLYHWHGVEVPENWITDRSSLDAKTAVTWPNMEQRRVATEILGWDRIIDELGGVEIDADEDPEIGVLMSVNLPDLSEPELFLRVKCGTGRKFSFCVPKSVMDGGQERQVRTALDAQYAIRPWLAKFSDFVKPEVRT
jgi:hypothetical protein